MTKVRRKTTKTTSTPTNSSPKVRQVNTAAAVKPLKVNLAVSCADSLSPKPTKASSPNSTAIVAESPSNSTTPTSMNPRVNLIRLPKYWDEFLPKQAQPPVTVPTLPLAALNTSTTSNRQDDEELLSTEKVISVLNSIRPSENCHCLLCSQEMKPTNEAESELQQKSRLLMETFCKIFNTNDDTFDPDSFFCCTNCIEELELLNYCNKELIIMTRQLELAREKLMKIMVKNYVKKIDKSRQDIEIGFDSETSIVDQLTEDWKLSLEYNKLNHEAKCAFSILTVRKKSKQMQSMRSFEYPLCHMEQEVSEEGEDYSFYNNDPSENAEEDYKDSAITFNLLEATTPKTILLMSPPEIADERNGEHSEESKAESSSENEEDDDFVPTPPSTIQRKVGGKQRSSMPQDQEATAIINRLEPPPKLICKFKCGFCTKGFFYASDLKKHEKTDHNSEQVKEANEKLVFEQDRKSQIQMETSINAKLEKDELEEQANTILFDPDWSPYSTAADSQQSTSSNSPSSPETESSNDEYPCPDDLAPTPEASTIQRGSKRKQNKTPNRRQSPIPKRQVFKRRHKKSHNLPLEIKCHLCTNEFFTNLGLRRHLQNKHNVKHQLRDKQKPNRSMAVPTKQPHKFKCRFCSQTCNTIGSLNAHEKHKHLIYNTKKYHCQFCTRIIPCIGKFIRHLHDYHLSSTKEVSYGNVFGYYFCDAMNCDECFISHEVLSTHIGKIHGIKFVCTNENCRHIFANKVNLDNHMKNVHHDNSGKSNFGCEYCHMEFRVKEDLEIHKEGHLVKIVQFENKCDICGKYFRTKHILQTHMSTQHRRNPPESTHTAGHAAAAAGTTTVATNAVDSLSRCKCRFCGIELKFYANIQINRRMHEYKCNPVQYLTADKPCLCKICFLCFGTEEELNSHQTEIHEPNKCKICNVQLFSSQGLTSHLLTHSSNGTKYLKTFNCKLCNITFRNRSASSAHNSIFHLAEREPTTAAAAVTDATVNKKHTEVVLKCNYGCEVETFGNPYLKRKHHVNFHADIHFIAGDAVYCKVCYEVYNTDEELTEHKLEHRTYRCKACGIEFNRKNALDEHRYEHKTNHPGFPCNMCEKIFKTPGRLSAHRAKVHLGNQQRSRVHLKANCQHCRKVLRKGIQMHRHLYLNHKEEYLKTTAHACTTCYAGFDTEQQLKKHLDTTHFKCQFCGRQFLTKGKVLSHENTHTGNQPFQCQICGKRFAHDPNLIAHMRTHNNIKGQQEVSKKKSKVTE